ncbi:hypothetical protein HMPREF9120_02458 [Neisseria sp. oral taxon 020 str. F0370]|nr:hypothetical protein HMPREF9120_02458 [Neisseria sp. oral taxon 020 str. F0370]
MRTYRFRKRRRTFRRPFPSPQRPLTGQAKQKRPSENPVSEFSDRLFA